MHIKLKSIIRVPMSVPLLNLLEDLKNLQNTQTKPKLLVYAYTELKCFIQSEYNQKRYKYIYFFTLDLGMRPTLKKPICPVSILVQSTTVDAMFSGEAPSHNTPST